MITLVIKEVHEYSTGGNGIRLLSLPQNGQFTITISLKYINGGRLDWKTLVADMEDEIEKVIGIQVHLPDDVKNPDDFEDDVKDTLIETSVQTIHDILGEFELNSTSLDVAANGLKIPLIYKTSGWEVYLNVTLGPDGKLNIADVAATLEQAFRDVFLLASNKAVFTADQRSDIGKRATEWVNDLLKEAGIEFPTVEVDWTSGTLIEKAVNLRVMVSGDNEGQYDLTIPINQNGKPDYSNIAQLARQISEQYSTSSNVQFQNWFCDRIVEQIQPELEEYISWVMSKEDEISQKLLTETGQGFQRMLTRAEELANEADKWNKEYQSFLKEMPKHIAYRAPDNDSISMFKLDDVFSVKIPELPKTLLENHRRLAHEIELFPIRSPDGNLTKVEEILNALYWAFVSIKIINGEVYILVEGDVRDALITALPALAAVYLPATPMVGSLFGSKRVQVTIAILDWALFVQNRKDLKEKITSLTSEISAMGKRIGDKIAKAHKDILGNPKK